MSEVKLFFLTKGRRQQNPSEILNKNPFIHFLSHLEAVGLSTSGDCSMASETRKGPRRPHRMSSQRIEKKLTANDF